MYSLHEHERSSLTYFPALLNIQADSMFEYRPEAPYVHALNISYRSYYNSFYHGVSNNIVDSNGKVRSLGKNGKLNLSKQEVSTTMPGILAAKNINSHT